MTFKKTCSLLLLGFLSVSSLSHAEDVTLEKVLTHALQESPLVRSIDARLADKMGEALQIKTLPNPVLDAEVRYPGSYPNGRPDSEVEASLEQPFRLSHLGLRQSVSSLIDKASSVNQKMELIEFSQNIRLAYAKVWALEEQRNRLGQAKKRAADMASLIRESSKQGLLPISEANLFRAQEKRLTAELVGLEADIKRSRANLIKGSNLIVGNSRLVKPELFKIIDEKGLLDRLNEGSIPAQSRVQLARKVASEQRRLSDRDAFPLLAPRFVYQHTSDGIDQFGAGIRIDLPFFDRNQGERLRRAGAESAAKSEEKYFQSEAFKEEVKLLLAGLKASKEQANIYEKEVVPALLEAWKGSEEHLKAGKGSAFDVFQTQREVMDASTRALELWIKAASEQSELVILLGDEF